MRHTIWLLAAGMFLFSACTLTTPTPNQGSTPSAIATVVPDQPAPAETVSGEMQFTATPGLDSKIQTAVPGKTQGANEPGLNQNTAGIQTPEYPYRLQSGTPAALQNFLNSDGCNYLGVGGQVFKLNGTAVSGLVVEITGTLSGKNVLYLGLTGNAQNLGPGGYEVKIGTQPVDSKGTLNFQIFDLNGAPQTPLIPFDTSADCTKNFVLVNFSESYPIKTLILLPVMRK
jgi:hypothetical protein